MRHEIRTILTIEDFLDINAVALGRYMAAMRIFGVVVVAVGLVLLWLGQDIVLWLTPVLAGAGILVTTSRPFLAWQIRRKAKGVVGSEFVTIVDDDGIEASNLGATAKVPWSSITKAQSNGRMLLLMREKVIFAWFSVRTLDPATRAQVFEIVQRHVPDFS